MVISLYQSELEMNTCTCNIMWAYKYKCSSIRYYDWYIWIFCVTVFPCGEKSEKYDQSIRTFGIHDYIRLFLITHSVVYLVRAMHTNYANVHLMTYTQSITWLCYISIFIPDGRYRWQSGEIEYDFRHEQILPYILMLSRNHLRLFEFRNLWYSLIEGPITLF